MITIFKITNKFCKFLLSVNTRCTLLTLKNLAYFKVWSRICWSNSLMLGILSLKIENTGILFIKSILGKSDLIFFPLSSALLHSSNVWLYGFWISIASNLVLEIWK